MRSPLLQETLDYAAACEALGCSRSYLLKLKNAGKLPYVVHAGKVRFYADGITAYCERLKSEAMRH